MYVYGDLDLFRIFECLRPPLFIKGGSLCVGGWGDRGKITK